MQTPTPKLAEGQITKTATNSLIEYTGVTSCLTFTILYSDGTASGGHAGMFIRDDFPPEDQRTIDQVVKDLKTQAQGKTIAKVILAGEIQTWNSSLTNLPNLPYHTVDDIVKDLNLSPSVPVTRYDSGEALDGSGAYMSLSADHHTFEVRSGNPQGQVIKSFSL